MFDWVSGWFYRTLAGIQPVSDAVGFDKVTIKSQPVGELKWVKASYDSVRGKVVSELEKTGDQFKHHVSIPVGATAAVLYRAKI